MVSRYQLLLIEKLSFWNWAFHVDKNVTSVPNSEWSRYDTNVTIRDIYIIESSNEYIREYQQSI